ncbi:MAG: hypothetical protein WKG00_38320 [Polyangiaceae bacterium]
MSAGDHEPGRKDRAPSEQVREGLGLLWKAARQTATGIHKELDKSSLGKSLEVAGREVERAVTNVASRIGEELKKVQPKDEPQWTHQAAAGDDAWPKTREEYEHRYGKLPKSVDWPRSSDAYEKRFGYKPGQKPTGPTDDDPGFGIAQPPRDDDKPQ